MTVEELEPLIQSGEVTVIPTYARCATQKDCDDLVGCKNPLHEGVKFTVPKYVRDGPMAAVNPEYTKAPFEVMIYARKSGHGWIACVRRPAG